MKDKIIILHSERVEYPRKDSAGNPTGELVQFTRIQYISDDSQNDSRYKGSTVTSGTGPIEMFQDLDLVPGLYEADFRRVNIQDRYNNSRASLEPVSVELVGDPGLTFEAVEVTA